MKDVREKLIELLTEFYGCDPMYYDVDALAIADHLIANGVTVHEWSSVEDRFPEEKANCIVYYQHAYCDNDGYWEIGICYYNGEKFKLNPAYKVTHWMPLPNLPKGE